MTSATAAIAIVPAWAQSKCASGISNDGSPLGTVPTSATPCAPRSNSREATSPPTTRTSAPGMRGAIDLSPKTTTSETPPTSTVSRCASPTVLTHDHSSWNEFDPDGIGSRQFGELADHDIDRGTEEEARDDGSREELRDPSHLEHGEEDEQDTRGERDPGNERRGVLLSGDLRRQHRAGGDRRQARARSGRDLSAGAEDGVQDGACGRSVEPVLQRDPRDSGVAEVLRNDQGSDGDTGDEIPAEPATIVGSHPTEDGNETSSVLPRCRIPPPMRGDTTSPF